MKAARAALCGAALLLGPGLGCSARPAPEAPREIGTGPVELSLLTPEGERLELRELRGRPLLLFVFTTYDQASQLALAPLTSFLSAHSELQALGIAAQPDPAELLPLYRSALAVPFPLVYERAPQIVSGESMLGPIETVPTYVLLDASGRIRGRHTGAMQQSELEAFTQELLSR